MSRSGLVAFVLALVVVYANAATAHYLGLTDSAIEVAEPGVRIVQTLPNAELAELGGIAGADASGMQEAYRQAVANGWHIAADGAACVLASASVRELAEIDALQFELRFDCANVVAVLEIDYTLAAEFEPSHVNLARVFIGQRQLPWRFSHQRRLLRLPIDTILARAGGTLAPTFRADDPNANLATDERPEPATDTGRDTPAAPEPAALGTIAAVYLPSGIEHILMGPDHVAFVLALVLVPLTIGRLLLAITLFTLAHSATLGLSYFQVLSLSPSITEPLIALSVAAVGIENLLAHRRAGLLRAREATVFFFGLVHGIGLSYQLGALPSPSLADAAARLLMFNVGIELGQLAILFFPGLGLVWAVNQPFGRYVTGVGSAILVGLGAYWFFTRLAIG